MNDDAFDKDKISNNSRSHRVNGLNAHTYSSFPSIPVAFFRSLSRCPFHRERKSGTESEKMEQTAQELR